MQGYVYLKRKLSGGSILSATIPAVTEEKHNNFIIIIIINFFSEVYFATGNREVGDQNLKLQFAVPYHVVSSLSHVQERRPWKTGGDLIVIDQLTMNSCVASGVLFSFGFFPSQFFLTEVF